MNSSNVKTSAICRTECADVVLAWCLTNSNALRRIQLLICRFALQKGVVPLKQTISSWIHDKSYFFLPVSSVTSHFRSERRKVFPAGCGWCAYPGAEHCHRQTFSLNSHSIARHLSMIWVDVRAVWSWQWTRRSVIILHMPVWQRMGGPFPNKFGPKWSSRPKLLYVSVLSTVVWQTIKGLVAIFSGLRAALDVTDDSCPRIDAPIYQCNGPRLWIGAWVTADAFRSQQNDILFSMAILEF